MGRMRFIIDFPAGTLSQNQCFEGWNEHDKKENILLKVGKLCGGDTPSFLQFESLSFFILSNTTMMTTIILRKCPSRSFPGVWELPLNQIVMEEFSCAMVIVIIMTMKVMKMVGIGEDDDDNG